MLSDDVLMQTTKISAKQKYGEIEVRSDWITSEILQDYCKST